jgi:hypothetical protein
MMAAVKFSEDQHLRYYDDNSFPDAIARCPFHIQDDEEFILRAFMSNHETFAHASERLRSSRDFVATALAWSHQRKGGGRYAFITHTTAEFQVQNPDLIIEAFDHSKSRKEWENDVENESGDLWFSGLNREVWSNKAVVMACVRKGWTLLEDEIPIDSNSPLHNDKEIAFLSIKGCPSNLTVISPALQQDREFILKLVTEIDSVLQHAPEGMKYNEKILLAAVARSGGAIYHCFDCFKMDKDFEFLCNFASQIRLIIATRKSFKVLLCGIADRSCPLSMLRQGCETELALKTTIAGFAGIRFPMISSLDESFQAALTNMEKFGF